jgi:hypothetical protein
MLGVAHTVVRIDPRAHDEATGLIENRTPRNEQARPSAPGPSIREWEKQMPHK